MGDRGLAAQGHGGPREAVAGRVWGRPEAGAAGPRESWAWRVVGDGSSLPGQLQGPECPPLLTLAEWPLLRRMELDLSDKCRRVRSPRT